MEEKLKAYHYKDEGVKLIIRIANSEPGAKHPLRQQNQVRIAFYQALKTLSHGE